MPGYAVNSAAITGHKFLFPWAFDPVPQQLEQKKGVHLELKNCSFGLEDVQCSVLESLGGLRQIPGLFAGAPGEG